MLIKRQIILILNKLESCAVLINSNFDLLHYYNNHKQIIKKGSAHFSANIMLLAISSTTTAKNKAYRVKLRTNCWRLKSKSLQTSNQVQFWKMKIFHSGFKSQKSIVCKNLLVFIFCQNYRFRHQKALTTSVLQPSIWHQKYWPKLTSLYFRQSESHAPKFNFQNCSFWKYFCS